MTSTVLSSEPSETKVTVIFAVVQFINGAQFFDAARFVVNWNDKTNGHVSGSVAGNGFAFCDQLNQ